VPKGTRLSRGDRRRNERLTRLRLVVRRDLAVVAVDLASARQAVVVADHDSRVLGRRMFRCTPWGIDSILDWAVGVATHGGFDGVVLGCEPTGHRWEPLLDRSRARGIAMVCVNPMLVAHSREGEDFTRDRSDFKDSTVIARLVSELRCFVPYSPEGEWARLRHLGRRRADVVIEVGSARQTLADLLECAWPTVLEAAGEPFDSTCWRACLDVSTDPTIIAAMTLEDFGAQVRAALPRWGAKRPWRPILCAVWDAAHHPGGVAWERPAALERAALVLEDWRLSLAELACLEDRMVAILDNLDLTGLVCTIPALSAVGAAAILAEIGDPDRFDCARAWVKHAGVCPRDNESGNAKGPTKVSGRGRPLLRTPLGGPAGRSSSTTRSTPPDTPT
jgi:transposase